MPKLMMIQPGAAGDIFVCLPIAKWWVEQGYEIFWPVEEQHVKHFRNIDYVDISVTKKQSWENIVKDCLVICEEQNFDGYLNLADRGPGPTAQRHNENFEQVKYRLSGVPFKERHNLQWTQNAIKEDYVFEKYVGDLDSYAFVHDTSSDGELVDLPDITLPIIRCEDFSSDYNIFDWYSVIVNADELYVTESSVWCFCDGIVHELSKARYLLPRKAMKGCTTVSNYWDKRYLDG